MSNKASSNEDIYKIRPLCILRHLTVKKIISTLLVTKLDYCL